MPCIPSVHLNGTGKADLLKQWYGVAVAVSTAMDALAAASPHGRDYYPQGDDAIVAAAKEHRERMAKLAAMHKEAEEIYLAIDDGGFRKEAA
jgi:hypothetical protein